MSLKRAMHKKKARKRLQERQEGFEEEEEHKTHGIDIMKTKTRGVLKQYTRNMRSAIRQTMLHKLDKENDEESQEENNEAPSKSMLGKRRITQEQIEID